MVTGWPHRIFYICYFTFSLSFLSTTPSTYFNNMKRLHSTLQPLLTPLMVDYLSCHSIGDGLLNFFPDNPNKNVSVINYLCLFERRRTVPYGMSSYRGLQRIRREVGKRSKDEEVKSQRCACAVPDDPECWLFCQSRSVWLKHFYSRTDDRRPRYSRRTVEALPRRAFHLLADEEAWPDLTLNHNQFKMSGCGLLRLVF